MIVLNKDPAPEVAKEQHSEADKNALHIQMFKWEIDAYCGYKEWAEKTEDPILEMALDEIMKDEYLHAKFLREYLIRHDVYKPHETDEYEIKFHKIHEEMIHN